MFRNLNKINSWKSNLFHEFSHSVYFKKINDLIKIYLIKIQKAWFRIIFILWQFKILIRIMHPENARSNLKSILLRIRLLVWTIIYDPYHMGDM